MILVMSPTPSCRPWQSGWHWSAPSSRVGTEPPDLGHLPAPGPQLAPAGRKQQVQSTESTQPASTSGGECPTRYTRFQPTPSRNSPPSTHTGHRPRRLATKKPKATASAAVSRSKLAGIAGRAVGRCGQGVSLPHQGLDGRRSGADCGPNARALGSGASYNR